MAKKLEDRQETESVSLPALVDPERKKKIKSTRNEVWKIAAGLVENGKEPESKDQLDEGKPDIISTIETKLGKDVKLHVIFPRGIYTIIREMAEEVELRQTPELARITVYEAQPN